MVVFMIRVKSSKLILPLWSGSACSMISWICRGVIFLPSRWKTSVKPYSVI